MNGNIVETNLTNICSGLDRINHEMPDLSAVKTKLDDKNPDYKPATSVRSEWDKLSLKLQTLSSQSAQTGGLRVESWTGKRSRSWTRRTASTSRCSVRVWRRASIRRQRWDHGILKVSPLNVKSDLTALFYCYSGVGYCYLWSFLWIFCTSCWKCLVACLDIVKTFPSCYRQINSWPSLQSLEFLNV